MSRTVTTEGQSKFTRFTFAMLLLLSAAGVSAQEVRLDVLADGVLVFGVVSHADGSVHVHELSHSADHSHSHAAEQGPGALLFIENVGNLVCPAMWDLGERAKVAILSVTEG